jgi:hypothetical protein
LPRQLGASYGSLNDRFHAETNSCGMRGSRRAHVSFAQFGGTAVS